MNLISLSTHPFPHSSHYIHMHCQASSSSTGLLAIWFFFRSWSNFFVQSKHLTGARCSILSMKTTDQVGLRSSFGRYFFSFLVLFWPIIVRYFCTKKSIKRYFSLDLSKIMQNLQNLFSFSFQGLEIGRYFIKKKVYKTVFWIIFGLDVKIVRYLVGGTFHTECSTILKKKWAEKH